MTYFLGIDLGTTYTAAAVHDGDPVHGPEIVPLGDRGPTVPSVLYLQPDGGWAAGDAAERHAVTDPQRIARQFKRRLGDPTPLLVGDAALPAEVLTGHLLRWVVDAVVRARGGERPATIVLTHPANWGPYKRDLLDKATELAGLSKAVLVTEPQAAAISYSAQARVDPGAVVAVYDLGGGTFDAAVLRKEGDGGFTVLGTPEGIEHLGGIDVDAAVFAHVIDAVADAYEQLDPDDPQALAAVSRLRLECTQAKEALSLDSEITVPVLLPTVQTEVRVTRGELESMIRPTLAETVTALERALRSASLSPAEVDHVLLVGGSSRIPLVAELVSSGLGRPVAVDAHPKHAIALGAALVAARAGGALGPPGTPPPPPPAHAAAVPTAAPPRPAPPGAARSRPASPTGAAVSGVGLTPPPPAPVAPAADPRPSPPAYTPAAAARAAPAPPPAAAPGYRAPPGPAPGYGDSSAPAPGYGATPAGPPPGSPGRYPSPPAPQAYGNSTAPAGGYGGSPAAPAGYAGGPPPGAPPGGYGAAPPPPPAGSTGAYGAPPPPPGGRPGAHDPTFEGARGDAALPSFGHQPPTGMPTAGAPPELPPGYLTDEARARKRRRDKRKGRLMVLVGLLLLLAAVGITVKVQADQNKPDTIAALDVGQCFTGEATDVTQVDCAQPHQGELFATAAAPDPKAAFPGVDKVRADAGAVCVTQLTAYFGAGGDVALSKGIDISPVTPSEDQWTTGNTTSFCVAVPAEGESLRGSIKGKGTA